MEISDQIIITLFSKAVVFIYISLMRRPEISWFFLIGWKISFALYFCFGKSFRLN